MAGGYGGYGGGYGGGGYGGGGYGAGMGGGGGYGGKGCLAVQLAPFLLFRVYKLDPCKPTAQHQSLSFQRRNR